MQSEGIVIHVVADKVVDRTDLLRGLGEIDVDGAFDGVRSRADEMRQGGMWRCGGLEIVQTANGSKSACCDCAQMNEGHGTGNTIMKLDTPRRVLRQMPSHVSTYH